MPNYWPISSDYFEAVQMPDVCCSDPDLKSAEVATLDNGLPKPPCAGNFADVYQFRSRDGQKQWAVKCFTRPMARLNERYREISRQLEAARLPFTVEFKYLEHGMKIRGEWYPVVKMDWVEGLTLRQFVTEYLSRPRFLTAFFPLWLKMLPLLREAGVAHGDLQHGNVMLVPGSSEGKLALRLIDYDGMWVRSLAGQPPGEVGHPCYQHPQRAKQNVFSPEIDFFPHLVIACALRCLSRPDGARLWKAYDNGDNLLFRRSDFESPAKSPVLHELWETGDAELQAWVARLAVASQAPLVETPYTEQLCLDGRIQPVTRDVEQRARQVLGVTPKNGKFRRSWMIEDAVANTAAKAPARIDRDRTISDDTDDEGWLTQALEETEEKARKRRKPAIEEPPQRFPPERIRAYLAAGTLGLVAFSILQSFIVGSLVPFTFVAGIGSLANLGTGLWLRRRDRDDARFTPKYTHSVQQAGASLMAIGCGLLLLASSFVYWLSTRPREQSLTVAPIPSPASSQGSQNASTSGTNAVTDGQIAGDAPNAATEPAWNVANVHESATFTGHTREVLSVSFSADGKWLASASYDKMVNVWDATSGQETLTLKGHTGAVTSVAFSTDGKRLASASDDKTVKVWDATSGQETLTLKGHTGAVTSVALSADGKRLASASDDKTVKVWDPTSGQEMLTLIGHTDRVTSVAFSADEKRLASASWDQTVKVWDVTSGQETLTLKGHTSEVRSVTFSADGKRLASASGDQTVKVWDATSGHETLTLKGHTDRVTSVAFSADGKRVASTSFDQTVKVWDTTSGQETLTLKGHTDLVTSVAFSADGKLLASASWDRTVKVWEPGEALRPIPARSLSGVFSGVAAADVQPPAGVSPSPPGGSQRSPMPDPLSVLGTPEYAWKKDKASKPEDIPAIFQVKFETSKGEILIEVHRDWSPNGAARFYDTVKAGFYNDCRYFRVIPGFMVQWGINGDPKVQDKWRDANIQDDKPTGKNRKSNKRGFITYGKSGRPNSRTTQLFINYGDNSRLDKDGFTPFGEVIEGMDVVDKINAKHGERPNQGAIQEQGNAYLNKQFPDLDSIKKATIVENSK